MVLIGLVDFGSSEMENLSSGRVVRLLAISDVWYVVRRGLVSAQVWWLTVAWRDVRNDVGLKIEFSDVKVMVDSFG